MLHQAQIPTRKSSFAPSLNPAPKQNLDSPLEMMGSQMRFGRNAEIYGEAEPAEYLYKVVSGAVRTYKVLADGRRQIGAFYLPGDIFGLEAGAEHAFSAEAVSDSNVLVIKRSAVMDLAARNSGVAQQLWTVTGCELQRAQEHVMFLIKSAQERVAGFLVEMAKRAPGAEHDPARDVAAGHCRLSRADHRNDLADTDAVREIGRDRTADLASDRDPQPCRAGPAQLLNRSACCALFEPR